MVDSERMVAQRAQEKYEFYSVSLAFTVLALSVQTAEFGFPLRDVIELSAWTALLFSGISGLKRLENVPYQIAAASDLDEDYEKWIDDCKSQNSGGLDKGRTSNEFTSQNTARLTKEAERLEETKKRLDTLDRANSIRYRRHSFGLAAGLALLVAARGIEPIWDLLRMLYGALST